MKFWVAIMRASYLLKKSHKNYREIKYNLMKKLSGMVLSQCIHKYFFKEYLYPMFGKDFESRLQKNMQRVFSFHVGILMRSIVQDKTPLVKIERRFEFPAEESGSDVGGNQ